MPRTIVVSDNFGHLVYFFIRNFLTTDIVISYVCVCDSIVVTDSTSIHESHKLETHNTQVLHSNGKLKCFEYYNSRFVLARVRVIYIHNNGDTHGNRHMDYEVCASCTCPPMHELTDTFPDQCSMCGGVNAAQCDFNNDGVTPSDALPFHEIQSCYKNVSQCCVMITVCCMFNIPYSEWVCFYPLSYLGAGKVNRYVNG